MKKFLLPLSYFLIFILSTGSLAYGWLLWQMDKAQKASANGDAPRALEIYARLEALFHKVPWLPRVLEEEYQNVSFSQVSILYGQGKNDEALKKLEQLPAYAPSSAESREYSFWSGNLLFSQAVQTKDPESSANSLKAALSEYQRGLMAEPDDWDLKYNYELVKYILIQKGREQKKEGRSILEKMRPRVEPAQEQLPPEKRG